jgi:hypothetical protein
MTRLAYTALAMLALAGCEDSTTSSSPSAAAETRFVGMWAPVMNFAGNFWDVRSSTAGVVVIRSGFLNDSLPFTYSASGGNIRITLQGKEESGTYRFFGSDSLELKTPSTGYLMTRISEIPAP